MQIENLNAVFINYGLSQTECLNKVNRIAIQRMKVLENVETEIYLLMKNQELNGIKKKEWELEKQTILKKKCK